MILTHNYTLDEHSQKSHGNWNTREIRNSTSNLGRQYVRKFRPAPLPQNCMLWVAVFSQSWSYPNKTHFLGVPYGDIHVMFCRKNGLFVVV